MYFTLLYYPDFSKELDEAINAFRKKYDPYVASWKPHITLIFPVSDKVLSQEEMISHIRTILKDWKPIKIHINGFEKSWDHWAFVLLEEGNKEVIDLHDAFYVGPLASELRKDIEYIPHIGIGLFVDKDSGYTLKDPQKVTLDEKKYEKAAAELAALNISHYDTIEKFSLEILDDDFNIVDTKEILI